MPVPTTVGPSDVSLNAIQASVWRTFQRKAFFAMGRHWVFYVDDGGILVYDSSIGDTGIWEGPAPVWFSDNGSEFSVFLQEVTSAEAYVHLVWADSTGNSALGYFRGILGSDGVIDWDDPDIAVEFDLGWEYENLGICMDFSGRIYVVYNKVSTADPNSCTPYVCQSTTSDGTWTTGAGFPLQITGVQDGAWIPLVAPYGDGAMVVYAADNGNIYSRVMVGGAFTAQVDTGFNIGPTAARISIVSETIRSGLAAPTSRAVYVAYQAADWDLYCIRYENDAWQALANLIETIGAFREASPMLSILDTGDSDDDHGPATLYCFWTPTADAPTAEWVTYRVSRDLGITWTNEAGADAAEEWIDETLDGFEIQASGSVYYFSTPDYNSAKSTIGIVYVVHRMPAALRHAALDFDDPDVDLEGKFIVRHVGTADLAGEFFVRHPDSEDLPGEFIVRHEAFFDIPAHFDVKQTKGIANLPGEFLVRHADAENLFGEFNARHSDSEDLAAEFVTRRSASEDLGAEFIVGQWAVDLFCQFDVGQGAVNLKGEFIVRQEQDENLKGIFNVQQSGDAELLGILIVRHSDAAQLFCQFDVGQGSEDLFAQFVAQRSGSQDLPAQFFVLNAGTEDLKGEFVVRRSDAENLLCIFIVRHASPGPPNEPNLLAFFRIDKDHISKGLNVSVYRDLTVIS